ncbi:hypothetical protein K9M79_07995 [Candidatus Woesearchaeota archaeon]|nr:hypothetical protein [Candidatus Woesearchaeota archaeon]
MLIKIKEQIIYSFGVKIVYDPLNIRPNIRSNTSIPEIEVNSDYKFDLLMGTATNRQLTIAGISAEGVKPDGNIRIPINILTNYSKTPIVISALVTDENDIESEIKVDVSIE